MKMIIFYWIFLVELKSGDSFCFSYIDLHLTEIYSDWLNHAILDFKMKQFGIKLYSCDPNQITKNPIVLKNVILIRETGNFYIMSLKLIHWPLRRSEVLGLLTFRQNRKTNSWYQKQTIQKNYCNPRLKVYKL